jgi:four helix bundle protein
MFDFEKLTVYTKAKSYNLEVSNFFKQTNLDMAVKNQLRRSSLSIVLNIAEGTGRKTRPDKRNFFVIARGSVFECVAIFDILKDEGVLSIEQFQGFYMKLDALSRMLYAMIYREEKY